MLYPITPSFMYVPIWYGYSTFAERFIVMGKIEVHNKEVKRSAEYRANQMKIWPSPLEEKMALFLTGNNILFETQKIFYIYADDGWINTYYIADFYIPSKKIIIEVDGKFHDKHKQHDRMRTKEIQNHYPGVEVLRYRWKDLSDTKIMDDLLCRLS